VRVGRGEEGEHGAVLVGSGAFESSATWAPSELGTPSCLQMRVAKMM
jgi:hypothetical protein